MLKKILFSMCLADCCEHIFNFASTWQKKKRCKMKILENAKGKTKCTNCGYTTDGRFKGDICPKCGLAYWECTGCGFLITAEAPPDVCPVCNENCALSMLPVIHRIAAEPVTLMHGYCAE